MDSENSYPMPQSNHSNYSHAEAGALHYQINNEEIIDEVMRSITGQVKIIDYEKGIVKWIIPQDTQPIINRKGANFIRTKLNAYLTKIFTLSDINDDIINNITLSVSYVIIDELYYNWEEYDIKNTADASFIVNLVTDTIYATLRKSNDGAYLSYLKTSQTISDVQQRIVHQEKSKSSIGDLLDKFKGERAK